MIVPIEWQEGSVRFLDQTRLPLEVSVVCTKDYKDLIDAIRSLKLRGAPLIGIGAAYGVALAAAQSRTSNASAFRNEISGVIDEFAATRPTAVNLFWALQKMRGVLESCSAPAEASAALLREARSIHHEDAEMCDRIGKNGAVLVPEKASILTHCNAGALATGGRGTAVGVITTAAEMGKRVSVFVDETRPLLQGARLTMWEFQQTAVEATLITDNAAASLFRKGKIDLVVTGADRIAANGDSANKIGTYNLAVLAHHHGVPMYIAAPRSTIDPTLNDGNAIPIEERAPEEVTRGFGVRTAPEGINVYAPAFDITPASLITAIITDQGVFRYPYDFHSH
ncbi:MAG TPA: S-methyl-5-thioribose-1-phosphate isomerase [Bacteroidota bacterium]|nr:S-methyl-5-thioribose-1-phosphate isomerase [Bacteroidota bacterium]